MRLLQNIHRLLGISPTNQPQDVEKDTQRKPALGRLLTGSANQHPVYRGLPIISGILIPFSILLSIPSLTDSWYIRTDAHNVIVEVRPNSFLLNLGIGFSMAFGILANICLIVRFSERKVLGMTWSCILFLTLHDVINISAVAIFSLQHHFGDGLTYGQSFWFSICSTIASVITNITLIIDYARTKDFVNCGSGLTDKQRSLVIIIIVLLCYLGLGSLISTFMLKISFIDAIYFCVVSIETIGFGDIHPTTTGTRIFNSIFVAGGILNLTLAVALIRDVLLEGVALGFQDRVNTMRAHQRERRVRTRWRAALKLRLRANNHPMWVVDINEDNDQDWQYYHHHHWWRWARRCWISLKKRLSPESADKHRRKRKHLNLTALTEAQMEEAALEAGAPLADLLPPGLHLASFVPASDDMEGEDDEEHMSEQDGVPFLHSMTMRDEAVLQETLVAQENIAFFARLTVTLLGFIVFWMVGSVVFMTTEKWDFGTAAYFCFIAFTTVGYGDYSPQTPAGRSIFVVWALLGVATMTILISILVEAYSRQFKSAIRTDTSPYTPNGTRQIRFSESSGTVRAGTSDLISSRTLSATLSSSGDLAASSSTAGEFRDREPSMASISEDDPKKDKKNTLESLQEILRHAQSLQSLIAPENWVVEDTHPIESMSSMRTPPVTDLILGDTRGPMREVHELEKNMEEIISATLCALENLEG